MGLAKIQHFDGILKKFAYKLACPRAMRNIFLHLTDGCLLLKNARETARENSRD